MKEEKYGQCHLCGERTKLTYEHVPPRKAFNDQRVFLHWGIDILGRENFPWDFSGLKGEQHQRGVGWHTLCAQCNNNTGGWYGKEFIDFTHQGYKRLFDRKNSINHQWIEINFRKIYPLRIIKQVITMFFSINNPGFSAVHPELRTFVLDKEKRGISKKFGIYLYVLTGSVRRHIGMSSIIQLKPTGNITRVLSELSAPPFGYVFEINPEREEEYCDISYFADEFSYGKEVNLLLKVPIHECNTYHPADYRTKKEAMNDYIKNKLLELQKN